MRRAPGAWRLAKNRGHDEEYEIIGKPLQGSMGSRRQPVRPKFTVDMAIKECFTENFYEAHMPMPGSSRSMWRKRKDSQG